MIRFSILFLFVGFLRAEVDECTSCREVSAKIHASSMGNMDEARVQILDEFSKHSKQEQEFINTLVRNNFRKLYLDTVEPVDGMTVNTTCADLGYCREEESFLPTFFKWTDNNREGWVNNSQLRDQRDKRIIMLHHTVTPTLQGTLDVLWKRELSVHYIGTHFYGCDYLVAYAFHEQPGSELITVDRDGKVTKCVDDHRRAWHAGKGIWRGDGCLSNDTNLRAVGIETVNNGAEPFPREQIEGIHKLVKYLQAKWHVAERNVIAHHESGPDYKQDISGYFSWKELYDDLGMWSEALWKSDLNEEKQKEVVLSAEVKNATLLKEVQERLFEYGYGSLVIGSPYDNSTSDVTTAMAVQSFNRKYVPELFIKEKVENDNMILLKENEQVYGLTLERLRYVSEHKTELICPVI